MAELFGSLLNVFLAYLVRMAIKLAEFLAAATMNLLQHVRGELTQLVKLAP